MKKNFIYFIVVMFSFQSGFVCGMELKWKLARTEKKLKTLRFDFPKDETLITKLEKKRLILEKLLALDVEDGLVDYLFKITKQERIQNITDEFLQEIIRKKQHLYQKWGNHLGTSLGAIVGGAIGIKLCKPLGMPGIKTIKDLAVATFTSELEKEKLGACLFCSFLGISLVISIVICLIFPLIISPLLTITASRKLGSMIGQGSDFVASKIRNYKKAKSPFFKEINPDEDESERIRFVLEHEGKKAKDEAIFEVTIDNIKIPVNKSIMFIS